MAGTRSSAIDLLAVIPQTSTIASHLPRAVGIAFAIDRAREARRRAVTGRADAVVVCSFGDASLNHATAQAALNTAAHCAHQGLPLPLLLVCEDNGLGISVPSPAGWVERRSRAPGLRCGRAGGRRRPGGRAGGDARARRRGCASNRRPAVLHLRTVRYLSHAGADVETAYRTARRSARTTRATRCSHRTLARRRRATRPARSSRRTTWSRASEVRALAAGGDAAPAARDRRGGDAPAGAAHAVGGRRRDARRRRGPTSEALTLAQAINRGLADVLEHYPETLLFGEDVAVKGGVYGVTRGLHARFGAARVFDTLLDETSILGLALGTAVSGFVPIPEIQYLAYLHNAEDQLRGEAATLQFFSQGAYRNGMVVRIAGLRLPARLRRALPQRRRGRRAARHPRPRRSRRPSRPDDAASMLRTCVAAAKVDGSVCVFLEPIALYHTRDLHEEGDGLWLAELGGGHVPVGSARTHLHGDDLTIVTWGNGLRMSLRVAERLAARGVRARVVDLRWLAPLPLDDVLREARRPAVCSWSTRRAAPAASRRASSPRWSTRASTGASRAWPSKDSFVPLGDGREPRAPLRGRDRGCRFASSRALADEVTDLEPGSYTACWDTSPCGRVRSRSSPRDLPRARSVGRPVSPPRRVSAIGREGSVGRVGFWRPHFPLRGAGGLSARPFLPSTWPPSGGCRYSSTYTLTTPTWGSAQVRCARRRTWVWQRERQWRHA